jgi:hypothetical protein
MLCHQSDWNSVPLYVTVSAQALTIHLALRQHRTIAWSIRMWKVRKWAIKILDIWASHSRKKCELWSSEFQRLYAYTWSPGFRRNLFLPFSGQLRKWMRYISRTVVTAYKIWCTRCENVDYIILAWNAMLALTYIPTFRRNMLTIFTLMMEAVNASETSVSTYKTTRCNIPENINLYFY